MASKTLQQITDAWGQWMNTKYNGGGIWYTESTNYNSQSSLGAYHQYQTSATYQSTIYDPYAPSPIPGTASSVLTSYNNDSSIAQSYTYQQSMTTTQSFTWSITESLSVGVSVTATVGVPAVAQVGTTVTTSFSLSSTQGSTTTNQQQWSVSQPIIAPAYSHIEAKMVVTTQQYDIKWQATCMLSGYVAIWFNDKVCLNPNDPHWLWFIPIDQVFRDCINNNIIDTSGYQIVNGGVLAYSSGVFTGGQGVGVSINVHQSPLSRLMAEQPAESYDIPINKGGVNAIVRG